MIKPIVSMLGLFGLLPLWAGVFTILPDKAGKWNEATSYLEGTGTPGADDVVLIPGSTDVAANAADIQFLENNGVGSICFGGKKGLVNPTLTVTVAEGDVAFSGRITNRNSTAEWTYSGTVVKNGGGIFRLAQDKGIYGLCVDFVVNDGVLELPKVEKTGSWNAYYGKVTVNAPGVLWPTVSTKSYYGASWFNGGLWGDGVVSNTLASPPANVYDIYQSAKGNPVFSGRIDGNVRVYARGGAISFDGTNSCNTASVHTLQNNVNLKMFAIGGTYGGQSNPGSLGSSAYYSLENDPTVTYLGTNEISYADFRAEGKFASTFTLDGGATGRFEHRGLVSFSGSPNNMSTLVLAGDHTNACTLASAIKNTKTDVARTTRLVKRGSGTWKMKENAEGTLNGLVTVEDGILTADTLAETNSLCALGFANALEGAAAIVLGASSTTGTLAYAGTAAASVSTRRIALAGDGRLTSATAKLDWTGVTSADAQAHTLTVGGAADGVVRDIADGAGKVCVVKEGTGTWTLGGDLDFTGGLKVKAGTANISSATNAFAWYRFVIKEGISGKVLELSRLAFFDADGGFLLSTNDIVRNDAAYKKAYALKPNEATLYAANPATALKDLGEGGDAFEVLFRDNVAQDHRGGNWTLTPAAIPALAQPESWIGIIVRLPVGSVASSYDIGSRFLSSEESPRAQMIQSWSVEGSLDGVNWTELHSVVSNRICGAAYRWRNGAKAYYDASTPVYKKGQPILSGIAPTVSLDRGLDDVSVAVGATLTTDKNVVVRKITIDAAGMGSLSGVTLVEGGVIDIANAPAKGKLDVPVDLTAVTLPASYSFTVNGSVSRRSIELSADRRSISIRPAGLMLIIR